MINYRGLCVVPIRRKIEVSGYVSDIVHLSYLDSVAEFSDKMQLALTYLSFSKGIVFYDSFLSNEIIKKESKIWDAIVSEQIFRMCLSFSVPEVWLMSLYRNDYKGLISFLRARGVKVRTPLYGYTEDIVPIVLRDCFNKEMRN